MNIFDLLIKQLGPRPKTKHVDIEYCIIHTMDRNTNEIL